MIEKAWFVLNQAFLPIRIYEGVKLSIDSLEIQDKDRKNVIEVVRRKEAAEICSKLIQSKICKWESLELDKLVNDFYTDKLINTNNKEWKGLGEQFATNN